MNAQSTLATVMQLTRDTFRQAIASGIFWIMLAGTAICVLLCFSVDVSGDVALKAEDEPGLFLPRTSKTDPETARREGVETVSGSMTLAFGAVSFPIARDRGAAVHFLELCLAWGVAGTIGLLLALVWTAGFVPTFLEPNAAAVLLAKPLARWQLLLGKYVGVLTFVALQVALFVVLTWFALGIRTDVWDVTYWSCIPLMLLQFAIYYSFSVLIAVFTRSTVACVFGSVIFWLLAWGINYGSVIAHGMPESHSMSSFTLALTDVAYWISPKPIDAGMILLGALDADKPMGITLLDSGQSFSPQLSILSSFVIAGVLLGLSGYEFSATDY